MLWHPQVIGYKPGDETDVPHRKTPKRKGKWQRFVALVNWLIQSVQRITLNSAKLFHMINFVFTLIFMMVSEIDYCIV